MSPAGAMNPTQERARPVTSGWLMLPVVIALYIAAVVLFVLAFANGTTPPGGEIQPVAGLILGALVALAAAIVLCPGFFTLQPNESRVLVLFGNYRGTVRKSGFHWANPFYSNGPAGQGAGTAARMKAGQGGLSGRGQEAPPLQDLACAPAPSTATSSRSTTSAATPSRSPPWWCGASRTRPRPSSTSTTTRPT